jgi:PAS domain S-box-containing protein
MKQAEVESPTVLPRDRFVPLESILCTEELNRRPSRAPDYEAENCALVGLAQALADSPRTILQTMAEKMLEVFQCDSAGFSLLTKDEKSFYWPAIAGMWQPHIGGGTPRDFGPCGDVLDCNAPMLFTHWERRYPYLLAAMPLAQEGLLVPFYVEGKAVGTIWAIAHDDRRKFDAEDMRQLVSLGSFASSAYQVVAFLDALEQRDEALRQSCEELEDRVVERTSQLTAVNEELRHKILERDRAEAALRTSEGKYRDLINASPDAICVIDADHKCVMVNPACVKLAGRSEGELIGSSIGDTYLAEERHLLANRLEKLKAEGSFRFERKFVRGNGEVIPVEVSLSALRGSYYQAIIRDIGHRKRAEEELRRSEEYLAEGQRISHTGSWVWNIGSGVWFWSPESLRIFGVKPGSDDFSFEKLLERIHPEDRAKIKRALSGAAYRRSAFEHDIRAVLPGGVTKHVHFLGRPFLTESGEFTEFIGVIMDITERKRAEQALRASEQVARGQVEALVQSLDVLATAPEPEKFVGQMLSTIGRLLNAQSVGLWLFEESSDSFVCRLQAEGEKLAASDPDHPFIKDPLSWKRDPIIQELLFTAGPVVCEDVEADPRVSEECRNYFKRGGTKRFLAVPILIGGQPRGVIKIRHADRPPYRPEEIELTQALAHQVMLAIQLNEFAEQGQRGAVLEERNRMARDIHDTLAQGFTGVIVQLEAAEDAISRGWRKEADKHLQRVGELARRSLSEARRSVHALRPQALQEQNFWDALKGIIKNTTVGTALHTGFEARGKVPELPQPWQENLLHIGQEALTNALKYAHARNFKTRLSYKARELRLELRDDGDGFKIKDRHDGMGLTGMRERVEQMGGELKIASSSGKGTKITVVLPYNGGSMS